MKRVIIALSLVGLLYSCTTVDEKTIQGNNLLNQELVDALNGTKWILSECPSQELITLNGYSECNYFMEIEFLGNQVFIQHNNDNEPTIHHICYTEGSKLPLSIQACSNPTWKSFFWWDIESMDNKNLTLNLENLSFYPSYNAEFTFEKVN